MKDLLLLELDCLIDLEFIRKVWEAKFELPFLSFIYFKFIGKRFEIKIDHSSSIHPKPFKVSVDKEETEVPDLNAVIQFIAWKRDSTR